MAVVPTSRGDVFFLKGVPFTNDNKNVRLFNGHDDAYNYFSNRPRVHAMSEVKFVQNEGKNFLTADKSIDTMRQASYIMFRNTEYSQKWYYAFITELKRVSSESTEVYFELDTFQTWYYDCDFKQSYVVREHCPLWNPDGSPVINTVDEGLNYGTEYDNVKVIHHKPNVGIRFLVMVTKYAVHGTNKDKIMPSLVGVGQPFSYYILPFIDSDKVVWATIEGEQHRMSTLIDTLQSLYKDEKFTNNIATMFITEHTGLQVSASDAGDKIQIGFTNPTQKLEYAESEGAKMIYVSNAPNLSMQNTLIGPKYEGYRSVTESKLLMYPYTVLTMDDMRGNRQDYKNEYINSPDITISAKGSMGISNKTSYSVLAYNMDMNNPLRQWMQDEFGIQDINPNDVAIMTEMISAFMQGNKNSLINQKDKIVFNGYANIGSSLFGAASGMGKNAGANAMTGIGSSIGMVKGSGNAVLELQGINAKIDDIVNIPPQINKMGTNTSYDVGNGYTGVFLIKKQIKPEYQKKLEDFFKMFGYKKNEVKIPNLHTRESWNYVETKACNIIADFNAEDLNDIKAIFDNGVTLWHTNNVGDYSQSNGVI